MVSTLHIDIGKIFCLPQIFGRTLTFILILAIKISCFNQIDSELEHFSSAF